jgi:hypothetical protein
MACYPAKDPAIGRDKVHTNAHLHDEAQDVPHFPYICICIAQ